MVDMEERLKMFQKDNDMFKMEIPSGQDLTKKPMVLKSNAGSREDIFGFIKENAL